MMGFEDLTPEQQEKARACKTPEDILELAKEEGYELSNEELDAVSGGHWLQSTTYSEYSVSMSCQNYYCNSLFCNMVSCRSLRCSTYDYNDLY